MKETFIDFIMKRLILNIFTILLLIFAYHITLIKETIVS